MKQLSLPAVAVVSLACLGLLAGCSSSGASPAAAGSPAQPSAGNPSAVTAVTSAAAAAAGSNAGSATGSLSSCPSVAVAQAALGYSFSAPTKNGSDGSLVCNYSDSAGDNLVIVVAPLPGGTSAMLKLAMDSQAQAQKVSASEVSGLGDAAYAFTMNDAASNPDHQASSNLAVLVGNEDLDITATAPMDKVEALARAVIGG